MRSREGNLSPELETLDQLLGGDVPLSVIRTIFPDDDACFRGVASLVRGGDVLLLNEGDPVPEWRVRELLDDRTVVGSMEDFSLHLTNQGASRIA